jgi:hypothetical protein
MLVATDNRTSSTICMDILSKLSQAPQHQAGVGDARSNQVSLPSLFILGNMHLCSCSCSCLRSSSCFLPCHGVAVSAWNVGVAVRKTVRAVGRR